MAVNLLRMKRLLMQHNLNYITTKAVHYETYINPSALAR